MALEVAWMVTALTIVATVCIGVLKGILGDGVLFDRGPREFLLARLARYGDPFTISLMGRTYTVLNSPETMKFVLSTAHESFPLGYPVQFSRLFSREKFVGDRLLHFRKSSLSAASGDGLQKHDPFISSLASGENCQVLGESSCGELGGGVAQGIGKQQDSHLRPRAFNSTIVIITMAVILEVAWVKM